MTIQIQEIEYCKYNVTFLADPELVSDERKEILQDLAKEKPKVSGFRPGKAPTHALKQQYSKFIDQRLQQKLVSKGLEDFLAESDLDLVGRPYLSNFSFKDDEFSCGFVVHSDPKIELKEYKGFSIPKPQLSSTVEELQESLLFNLRKQYSTKIETNQDSVVVENDLVELDVKIYFEDKLISEKASLQCDLRNNINKLPEDAKVLFGALKPELLGMRIGETKTFEYQFTENLPENQKELANKLTKWEIKVNKIDRVEFAPLDDSLAKKYYQFSSMRPNEHSTTHPDEQNLTVLINELHGQATNQLNQELQKKIQDQVIARLLNNHQVEIPAWRIVDQSRNMAAQVNHNWDQFEDQLKLQYNQMAERSIKLNLILKAVKKQEIECQYSGTELMNVFSKKLESQGQNAKDFIEQASKAGTLEQFLNTMQAEMTLGWIVNSCKIEG